MFYLVIIVFTNIGLSRYKCSTCSCLMHCKHNAEVFYRSFSDHFYAVLNVATVSQAISNSVIRSRVLKLFFCIQNSKINSIKSDILNI